jgi:SAM-dependent methyltransferase
MPAEGSRLGLEDLRATQRFFGERAVGWDERFPDDERQYARAVDELAPPAGGVVADIACGTGRALPLLRAAVGTHGTVSGVDVTEEMLAEAVRHRRDAVGSLVQADAMCLPFADGTHDAVFGSGLLPHLPDPVAGLRELARICRRGARLALFHPVGRAVLAARRGVELDPADIRTEARIRDALTDSGWQCERVDDSAERYLVLAVLAARSG